jgi:glycosyltransferase involved in cell wall biosynthesis
MSKLCEKVTLILPCFNEEKAIASTLNNLLDHADVRGCEIVVVDDGSTDKSIEILECYRDKIKIVKHRLNLGYGSAIASGCTVSTREFVVWVDSDGQHQVKDVNNIITTLVMNDCDYVIGCRSEGSHQVQSRKLGKFVLRQMVRLVMGENKVDFNSGLRGFRTSVLRKYVGMLRGGFGASTTTTLLMHKLRYYGLTIPIDVLERSGESSVRQFRDGFRTLLLISRIALIFSPLKIIGSLGLIQLFAGLAYGLVKAVLENKGFPTFGLLIAVSGIQTVFLSIVLDQVSQLRMSSFED